MKAIVCEICNSRNFVKQDGMYICQQCGTKFTVEEAKKLMVEIPDSPVTTENSADANSNVKPSDPKKKKRRKKIIILVSVIVGVLILLSVGAYVGYNIYNDYKKAEVINNGSDEIFNNKWKSIDSDKTLSIDKNGGKYGEYSIKSWKYSAPVLYVIYQEPMNLFQQQQITHNETFELSWYQDDVLMLTAEKESHERFVKESEYDKVKGLIKQSENVGEQRDNAKSKETTEATLTDPELCAEYAVNRIKDCLKNPSSMIVNSLKGVKDEDGGDGYIFQVDYTAQNGFGGATREEKYIIVSKSGNGFAVRSIGAADFMDETSQKYTAQIFLKTATKGFYEFDPQTYRMVSN